MSYLSVRVNSIAISAMMLYKMSCYRREDWAMPQ